MKTTHCFSFFLLAIATSLTLVAQTAETDPVKAALSVPKPAIFAQKLVDQTLQKHPEIVILAFHVVSADGKDYPILASNIGRYGKAADEDDLRVIHTGKANLEVNETGNHFEVEMQIHDASNKVLGAVGVVYNYKAGDDKEALHKKAEAVRVEMEKQIKSLAALNAAV